MVVREGVQIHGILENCRMGWSSDPHDPGELLYRREFRSTESWRTVGRKSDFHSGP